MSKVGADAFMQKPFGPTKLLEMIEEYAVHIPLNILLIDDSLAFRLSIKSILQGQCGHTVAVAESGRDGLDAMKAEPFDMVLSDVQMPLLDGFKMTQELRAWEDANRPEWRQPLVLMSGNNTQEERTMVRMMCGVIRGGGAVVCVPHIHKSYSLSVNSHLYVYVRLCLPGNDSRSRRIRAETDELGRVDGDDRATRSTSAKGVTRYGSDVAEVRRRLDALRWSLQSSYAQLLNATIHSFVNVIIMSAYCPNVNYK